MRAKLFVLSYLPRHSFWDKLDYADRLEFLDAHVPLELIKSLPRALKEHDKYLDREMYATVQQAQQHGPGHLATPAAAAEFANNTMGGMSGMGGLGGLSGLGGLDGGSAGAPDGAAEQLPPLPKRNWED